MLSVRVTKALPSDSINRGTRCALICGFIKLEKATIMINKSKLIINSENLTLISSLRYDTDLGASQRRYLF